MAVLISAMAPNCTPPLSLHGSSRLSGAPGAIPQPALAKKDAQDTLFTDEEFQALMSGGQCELLSFSDNDLRSSSSLQLLCRDDDGGALFQEKTPPPFALDNLVEAPFSDGDIERVAPLFCDEEIQALFCDDEKIQAPCAAPAPQQASVMQFSRPRSEAGQAGKKRMRSPPWPSCVEDDDGKEKEAGPPPSHPPPPTKKARTQTKTRSRREHVRPPPPLPPLARKARMQTMRRCSRAHADAIHVGRVRHRLRGWHKTIATRILARQFRAPELSRGRTALRCQCPELAHALAVDEPRGRGGGLGCCALHQDAPPGDRAWMYSAAQGQGHGAPPLVGGPGEVLVPTASAGSSKAMLRQYARWLRCVSLHTRFYVQRAVEKGLTQLPDDDWTKPESYDWTMPEF